MQRGHRGTVRPVLGTGRQLDLNSGVLLLPTLIACAQTAAIDATGSGVGGVRVGWDPRPLVAPPGATGPGNVGSTVARAWQACTVHSCTHIQSTACAMSYTHTHVQSPVAMRYHACDSTAQHFRQHMHAYNSSLPGCPWGCSRPTYPSPSSTHRQFTGGRVFFSLPVHGLHRPAHTTAPAAVHDVRPRPRVSQHRSTASVVLVVLREPWLSGLTLWVCALYYTESLSAGRAFSPLNFIHSNQWRVLIPAKRVHCVDCPAMIVSWLCRWRWRCRPPVLTASYWLIVCVWH